MRLSLTHQDGNNYDDGVMDRDDVETSDGEDDNSADDSSDKYETDLDEEIIKSKYGISGKTLFFSHSIIDLIHT